MKRLLNLYNKYTRAKVLSLIDVGPIIENYIKNFIKINNIKISNQTQSNIIYKIVYKISKNQSFIK
jgi:hypothetical protein